MAKIERRVHKGIQGADLTPMIDVVFLLLVFFMVATNFVEETQQYDVALPKAENAEVAKIEDVLSVLVHSYEEGVDPGERVLFRVRGEPVSRRDLYHRLEEEKSNRDLNAVIIKADKDARYQDVISVISSLHALDIRDFSLAVMGEN